MQSGTYFEAGTIKNNMLLYFLKITKCPAEFLEKKSSVTSSPKIVVFQWNICQGLSISCWFDSVAELGSVQMLAQNIFMQSFSRKGITVTYKIIFCLFVFISVSCNVHGTANTKKINTNIN